MAFSKKRLHIGEDTRDGRVAKFEASSLFPLRTPLLKAQYHIAWPHSSRLCLLTMKTTHLFPLSEHLRQWQRRHRGSHHPVCRGCLIWSRPGSWGNAKQSIDGSDKSSTTRSASGVLINSKRSCPVPSPTLDIVNPHLRYEGLVPRNW